MKLRSLAFGICLAVGGLLCLIGSSTDAQSKIINNGPFVFVNGPFPANDFHAVFTGSGGTLFGPRLLIGPPRARITARGNEVDIVFPNPVAPGGTISFTVLSRFPIQSYGAYWTWNGAPVWPAFAGAVPEPKAKPAPKPRSKAKPKSE